MPNPVSRLKPPIRPLPVDPPIQPPIGPPINPAFVAYPGQIYILTKGGYYLSAANGGGLDSNDAIQTEIKYSAGLVVGPYLQFTLWRDTTGRFAFQTYSGNFIRAVDGGGLTTDVLNTNAPDIAVWEEFRIALVGGQPGPFPISIQTNTNNFLTAVGEGGKTTNAIHSDATKVQDWEIFFLRKAGDLGSGFQYFIVPIDTQQAIAAKNGGGLTQNTLQLYGQNGVHLSWARFNLILQPNGSHAIQTVNGNYLTAVNGGGLDYGTTQTDNIHTDATVAKAWEQFTFVDRGDSTYCIQTVSGYFLGKRTYGGSAEGEYSTDISDINAATKFWIVPANFL